MNWLDIGILAIIAGTIAVEAKRGFGKALFDFAAVLLALWGISRIEPLWQSSRYPVEEQAAFYAGSFVVIAGLLIAIGRLAHQSTLISAYPFDMILGGMIGIGAAIVLCCGMVHTVALTGGPDRLAPIVSSSVLGKEFITFDAYHRVVYILQHFNSIRGSD